MTRSGFPEDAVRAARRRLAVVMVEGLGSMGIRIAEQLITFGVGTVLLRDERPVTAADAGYRRADRGRPRAEAACQMLRPAGGPAAVLEAPQGSAVLGLDLHLITATDASWLHHLRSAAPNDSAVLPVELSGEGFCIGPLLRNSNSPGSDSSGSGSSGPDSLDSGSPCLDCLVLHGLHELPSAGPRGAAPAGPAEAQPSGPLEGVAAGIAAHQAQLLIDGQSAAAASGALFVQASTGALGQLAVGPHPECRCLTRCGPRQVAAPRPRGDDQSPSSGCQSWSSTG